MLSAIPEELACSFGNFSRAGNTPDATDSHVMNVKHTFIEVTPKSRKPHRARSLTDSELLLLGEGSFSDASTDTPSDEDAERIADAQPCVPWASPAWGPAEDAFYMGSPSDLMLPSFSTDECMGSYCPWSTIPDYFSWQLLVADQQDTFPWHHDHIAPPAPAAQQEGKTTVMLRNLPNHFKRSAFIEILEDEGFEGSFDLVYVPMDFSREKNLGYAFVNFLSGSDAARCWEAFDGFSGWGVTVDTPCEVVWSDPHQGTDALVERYRNSPVMHESVPEEWKPAFFVDGAQVPFPAPTDHVKAPKQKSGRKNKKGN